MHRKRHPKDQGTTEVATFLTHLAVEPNVAAFRKGGYAI